jgi:hypothetical protein
LKIFQYYTASTS